LPIFDVDLSTFDDMVNERNLLNKYWRDGVLPMVIKFNGTKYVPAKEGMVNILRPVIDDFLRRKIAYTKAFKKLSIEDQEKLSAIEINTLPLTLKDVNRPKEAQPPREMETQTAQGTTAKRGAPQGCSKKATNDRTPINTDARKRQATQSRTSEKEALPSQLPSEPSFRDFRNDGSAWCVSQ